LQIFIGSLFIILLLQLIAAIVGFTLRNKAEDQLRTKLINTLQPYMAGNKDIINEWDNLQQTWSCCGVMEKGDWKRYTNATGPPLSCCKDNNCPTDASYFNKGCYSYIRDIIFKYSKALGGVSIFFFFVEVIGLVLAVLLLRDLKNNYGSV
jgi:hypothetical protein